MFRLWGGTYPIESGGVVTQKGERWPADCAVPLEQEYKSPAVFRLEVLRMVPVLL